MLVCAALFLLGVGYVSGRTCEIEGLTEDVYQYYYTLEKPIHDTAEGVIASFKTRNILRIKIAEIKYLNATWENQTLTIFTSDNFKNFEKESRHTLQPTIDIRLDLDCTEDITEEITIDQPIIDINNNAPLLNKNRYDYVFGMEIPKDAQLTDILPITALDYDVTNQGVHFIIEDNEYFKLEYDEPIYYDSKEYQTKLVALQDIKAPFNQIFTITASDEGSPVKSSSAPLSITVSTPEELENNINKHDKDESMLHPPIFSQYLYFGNYTSNGVLVNEPILIKYGGGNDTVLKQSAYGQFFKICFEDSQNEKVIVEQITPLSSSLLERNDLITIEIEAVNKGVIHFTGRTALLIRLPKHTNNDVSNDEDCNLNIKYEGFTFSSYSVALALFLLTVFCIVFINIYVMIMFVNKQKQKL